jgi:hypothetical protein
MIAIEDGRLLVALARNAVKSALHDESLKVDDYLKNSYSHKGGVFVTITQDGELRGCIGFPEAVMPLYKAIVNAAKSAALEDPRFMPITKEEYKHLSFELSILTPPQKINVKTPEEYLKKIRIGDDGLIIRGNRGSGLLLPQVAIELHWDQKQFLDQICVKAGLERNAWKDLKNELYKFQAQIFSEENGQVVEKTF